MMINKDALIKILAGLAALLIAVGGVWYYYAKNMSGPEVYSTTNTPVDVLTKTNSDFVKAEALRKAGDYAGATASYEAALTKASDAVQLGQIKVLLANVKARNGDPIGAVRLDKEVAADTQTLNSLRANAIEGMAVQYMVTRNPAITDEIFKDEPYKKMYIAGDIDLSYRMLFDYGASFYPLAETEFFRTNWYANRIAFLNKSKTATSSAEIRTDLALIQVLFSSASADIERNKLNPDSAQLIPQALLRKAVTLEILSSNNFASSTDAEVAYKDALASFDLYKLSPGSDGAARFNYARFLARTYGDKRIADIQALLKPIYTNPTIYANSIAVFFRGVLTDKSKTPNGIKMLARLDANFKTYLISLGWKASAFK